MTIKKVTTVPKKSSSKISTKKVTSVSNKNEPKKKIEKKVLQEVVSPTLELKEPERKVPLLNEIEGKKVGEYKNYLLAFAIFIVIVLGTIFGLQIFKNYQEKMYLKGYFKQEKTDVTILSYDNVANVLDSTKGNAFFFFHYRENEDTYQLEKEIYQVVTDFHLADFFYYVDLTDMVTADCDRICQVNRLFLEANVSHVPAILFYQNQRLIHTVMREDQAMLKASDFAHVLDMYEFKK